LRFFAAADVVVFHGISPEIQNTYLHGLAAAGYQAVTFFFMLSGFILTYVYNGRLEKEYLNVPTREFWRARIARILPAYFLGLAIALPHMLYSTFISKMDSVQALIVSLVLVPLLVQAWWPPAAMAWNPPAWSLSVECFFYFSFPMLARTIAQLSRSSFLLLAFALVVVVAAIREAIPLPTNDFSNSLEWNFKLFFPVFHLPQFIFGMALGRVYLFNSASSDRVHAAMLSAGAVGVIVMFGTRSILPIWMQNDAALALLYGLVIFGGAQAGAPFKVLVFPLLTLLGEASYALYIIHLPIAWWWNWLTRGLFLPRFVSFFLYFLIVTVLSIFIYRWVERPARRWILGHREHQAV